ncbi:sugar transporter domain-containing protein [Phthorimaea operculella]|nr:sugar transporter domain-containing protein [Phthorimaea operculella]
MRSSLYRRTGHNNSDVDETDPLLPAVSEPESNVQIEHVINDGGTSSRLLSSPGRKFPQYAAALAANIGALAAGVMLGWSSPVMFRVGQPNSTDYDFPVSPTESDGISSIINLGAAASCYPIGLVMDSFGRKSTMLFLVLPFTAGWLFITFARSVGMLLMGRLLTGIAGGAFCVTAPTYTSEIAEDSVRGTLGTFYQLMVTIALFQKALTI